MQNPDKHKYAVKLDRNNTSFQLKLFEYLKNAKWEHKYDFLKYYQNIVRTFINDVDIDARGLLIAHSMGMGKSLCAIAIAVDNIKERQPIILLTKSLQENMRGSIVKYVKLRTKYEPDYYLGRLSEADLNAWIKRNFHFVSMNASNMLKQMGKAAEGASSEEFDAALEKKIGEVLKIPSLDGKLLIVDEAHNLFRAITNGSKNAIGLYDLVMKSKNLKCVFLSGTPIANDPFELVPCFNMLGSKHPGKITLPEAYKDFYNYFVDTKNGKIKNKGKFQNRILGLVSHVTHHSKPGAAVGKADSSSKVEFPTELPTIVERVQMDPEQFVIYQLARDKEREEGQGGFGSRGFRDTPSMQKPKSEKPSSYRVRSRQLSNYCAPEGFREEKDPNKIPEDKLDSPKFRAIFKNIQKHPKQLGVVYSQFVGVGGLGTFGKYLQTHGYKLRQVEVKKPVKPLKAAPGEQGELFETLAPPDEDTTDIKVEGGDDVMTHPVEPPTSSSYIEHIEQEATSADSKWWLGGDDEDDSNDIGSVKVDLRYAAESDFDALKEFDPEFSATPADTKYPKYIVIVSENERIVGYYCASVNIDDNNHACEVTIHSSKMEHVSQPRLVMDKIIKETLECAHDPASYKKTIWGGADANANASVDSRVDSSKLKNPPGRPQFYSVISGEISPEERTAIQDRYSSSENKHGGDIDLLLLSSTGAEGLDLKNVRHIHIMEPYWNYGRVAQIKFRGIRNDAHLELPEDEKNVQTYIYVAVAPEQLKQDQSKEAMTTDEELLHDAMKDQFVIDSFLSAVNEVCIECMLNGEKNCRTCSPTNQPLFSDDVARDLKMADPCSNVVEHEVAANKITVDGIEYYYVEDPKSIYDYKIFEFDKDLNGYRPLKESDLRYEKIATAIKEAAKK